jgi:hypothetical protein
MTDVRIGRVERAPICDDGALMSPHGEVHRVTPAIRNTVYCGIGLPDRWAPVTALQALVHKIPICATCYPFIALADRRHNRTALVQVPGGDEVC